jgi:lipoprotein-releasing system ATP-binding protein
MASFIRAENLVRVYRDGDVEITVLDGLDLSVDESEIVAIVGESGAGKSTLLYILGALDRPTSGRVFYEDRDVSGLSELETVEFRNREVGFVFQFHHLLPEFSAVENVALAGLIGGMARSVAYEKAQELVDYVGLGNRSGHRPAKLSGGERQRVALARALVNQPRVVLADEPTGNLDHKTSDAMHDLMWEMRERLGQTFVVVTHNEKLATRADRTVRLANGRVEGT